MKDNALCQVVHAQVGSNSMTFLCSPIPSSHFEPREDIWSFPLPIRTQGGPEKAASLIYAWCDGGLRCVFDKLQWHSCPFFLMRRYLSQFRITSSILGRQVDRHLLTQRMKRFRQACKLLIKESGSNKDVGVSREALVGSAPWHDEWGVLPHHFETVPPPREKVTKGGGSLKQTRSMPFPSRQYPDELAPPVPSPRLPPASRHTRKNSKVAQLLGIACSPEKTKDAMNAADPLGLMSPPLLPIEVDPFSCPLGATIVSSVTPMAQREMTHPLALQHTFRPMQSMPSLPSLSVPSERHGTHAHVPRAHASQSTSDFRVTADATARRAPRPLQRAGYAHIVSHSSRSLSNPPPVPSLARHQSSLSLSQPSQPSRVVNLESRSRHGSAATHTSRRGRHQNMRDHAPIAAPNLRKARSSVVLSNTRAPPLHAPRPVKVLERPSVETLHKLAESASSAMPSHSKARNREVAVHAVWPPAPVLRPLRNINAERDAFRTAAIEAEKTCRRITEERALLERARDVGDRKARRSERDPGDPSQRSRHHRRVATDGPRRRKRDVEYRTMADYGYDPTHQIWVGA